MWFVSYTRLVNSSSTFKRSAWWFRSGVKWQAGCAFCLQERGYTPTLGAISLSNTGLNFRRFVRRSNYNGTVFRMKYDMKEERVRCRRCKRPLSTARDALEQAVGSTPPSQMVYLSKQAVGPPPPGQKVLESKMAHMRRLGLID